MLVFNVVSFRVLLIISLFYLILWLKHYLERLPRSFSASMASLEKHLTFVTEPEKLVNKMDQIVSFLR